MSKDTNKSKKIKKGSFMGNVLLIMFSQILIKLLSLVYRIYLTNREGFGDIGNALYSAGYQIYSLLLLLSSIGIPNAVSKLVSEKVTLGDYKGAHKTFKVALWTVGCAGFIGSSFLFFGASYIANSVLGMPDTKGTLMCLAPSVFFVALSSVIRGYFNGRNTMKPTANSQSLEQIFKTIFTIVFIEITAFATSTNTVAMAVAANAATTFSVISSFIYIVLYFKKRKNFIYEEINSQTEYKDERRKTILKKVLSVAIPLSLTSIIVSINKTVDTITIPKALMTFLSSIEATRIYGIFSGKVDTLAGLPLSLNTAFSVALIPELAALKAANDTESITKKISLSLLLTLLIAFPCTFVLCVFAQPIFDLIFPNANSGAYILSAYAFIILFTMPGQNLNATLHGLGNLKTPVIALIIGVIVKTLFNIILVPIESIGIYGAIAGSIICYAIVIVIELHTLRNSINFKLNLKQCVFKPLIASIIMSISSYLIYIALSSVIVPRLATLISLGCAVVVYAIAIVLLKTLNKEDYLAIPKGEKIYKLITKFTKIPE